MIFRRMALAALGFVFICFGGEALAAPGGCVRGIVNPNAPIVGSWSLRQRDDDTGEWTGPWVNEFRRDGTFLQAGSVVGRWCVIDNNVYLFGFDEDPHTTYRGTYTGSSFIGTEYWDGGNTGTFELRR
jgi:hypothetical protein